MDYLVPLVESARPDSALSYAFNACAFAALGNRVRADNVDFASLALKQHTLALTRTHVALGDPKTANTDATLAAVLLLSMYEVCDPSALSCTVRHSPSFPGHHGNPTHAYACVA